MIFSLSCFCSSTAVIYETFWEMKNDAIELQTHAGNKPPELKEKTEEITRSTSGNWGKQHHNYGWLKVKCIEYKHVFGIFTTPPLYEHNGCAMKGL